VWTLLPCSSDGGGGSVGTVGIDGGGGDVSGGSVGRFNSRRGKVELEGFETLGYIIVSE